MILGVAAASTNISSSFCELSHDEVCTVHRQKCHSELTGSVGSGCKRFDGRFRS